MAKKAKARKAKAKKGKARRGAKTLRSTPAPTPTYLQDARSVDIPVHRVAEILATIHQQGHGDKFKRRAKAKNLSMTVNSETVNFVKDFMAENRMHAHRVGRQVINSGGTFDCTK
jgi:hypothetical protein